MTEFSTALDKCLCCGQAVTERRPPITPERADIAYAIFQLRGLTRDELLGKHRAQLEYQSPGMVEWLEGRGGSSRKIS